MKSIDKKVGDTTYFKYKINLPKKVVEESKFEGKELEVVFEKDRIIIKKEK
jgi:predicted metal-binding transcription factor (methanogenesis marker protein 9)